MHCDAIPGHLLSKPDPRVLDHLLPFFRQAALRSFCADAGRRAMLDPEKRKASTAAGRSVPQDPEVSRQRNQAYWSNPENRRRQSELKRKHRSDPRVDQRCRDGFRKSVQGRDGSGLSVGERKVLDRLLVDGYQVYRSGWPDFLEVHPDGRVEAFEVKTQKQQVRPEQEVMHALLLKLFGLKTIVVRESNVEGDTSELLTREQWEARRRSDAVTLALSDIKSASIAAREPKKSNPGPKRKEIDLSSVEGLTLAEAARRLGVSGYIIRQRRFEAGLPLTSFKPGRGYKDIASELSSVDGLTLTEAARKLRVTPQVVERARREAGYPSAARYGHIASRFPMSKREDAA